MNKVLVCAAFTTASLAVAGQDKRPVVVHTERFETALDPVMAGPMKNTFQWVSAEAGLSAKLVKGAPYSANAVTETVQTLADGNRITHATNASIARDSQGRTRREQSFPALGPWASEGSAPKMTTINDPVAGVSYTLNDGEKTARKLEVKTLVHAPHASGVAVKGEGVAYAGVAVAGAGAPMHMRTASGVPPGGENVFIYHSAVAGVRANMPQPKSEQLGQKTIEGVVADGNRTTIEIPAGSEGNERPIQIVDEHWYSQELQTTVMSRHSDPRSGETTFRLTNVSRAEPSQALFEVPADYKVMGAPVMVMDGPAGPMKIQIDRKP